MDNRRLEEEVSRLADLVSRLRGPNGCPWDARQTEDTIRMYLLEETYEVVDAVEKGVWPEICGELGDLLFQIVFLARLAEEKKAFDLVGVVEGITEKMIRRHPHVFGSVRADTPEEVAENWAKIKREENRGDKAGANDLCAVPDGLPALLRAHRLNQKAAVAVDVAGDPRGDLDDIEKDLEYLKAALIAADRDALEERLGALFFDLAGLAGRYGSNAEDVLRKTNRRFANRTPS
ncbi:MAG: nucleoside triphosphate pyrophosphohydrolase [Thermodesulfobacteriota bacterium]